MIYVFILKTNVVIPFSKMIDTRKKLMRKVHSVATDPI